MEETMTNVSETTYELLLWNKAICIVSEAIHSCISCSTIKMPRIMVSLIYSLPVRVSCERLSGWYTMLLVNIRGINNLN